MLFNALREMLGIGASGGLLHWPLENRPSIRTTLAAYCPLLRCLVSRWVISHSRRSALHVCRYDSSETLGEVRRVILFMEDVRSGEAVSADSPIVRNLVVEQTVPAAIGVCGI